MQLGFGADFRAARAGWLYERGGNHVWWMAVLLAVVGLVILFVFQTIAVMIAAGVHLAMDPALLDQFARIGPGDQQELMRFLGKDMIIGIGPAAMAAAAVAWWLAGIGVSDRWKAMQLRRIDLGIGGWLVVVGGFVVLMFAINVTSVKLSGFDETQVGMVEQAMADLRMNPWVYLLSLPGIMIFTPIVEEFIFRGALFHALLTTRLGASGTVLLTSACWAVIHAAAAPWFFVGLIFLMGIALGILLLRFGSLWVTIVCHATWNLLTAGLIFGLGGAQ